jgi:hypothetical protein
MSTLPIPSNTPAIRNVRAYFAAPQLNSSTTPPALTPILFDAALNGGFALGAPPTPWLSLGYISGFSRRSLSKQTALRTGQPATTLIQLRESFDCELSLRFSSWSKLTLALACGTQHINLLGGAVNSMPSGGGETAAAPILSGSTASMLQMNASDVANLAVGQHIVVDLDYAGQTGYVGSPIVGSYIRNTFTDVHYLRRLSFNLARISGIQGNNVYLSAPLPYGAPATGMNLKTVTGYLDREGGLFLREWSALFVMEGEQGDRILYHYPRLQSTQTAAESIEPLDAGIEAVSLAASFRAMPVTDPLDGETVLCYRSYLPAANY